MNIASALASATETLASSNVAEPRREASSLLSFAIDRPTAFLVAHPEYELSEAEAARFGLAVSRRARHEPFQYIVGKQEFFGMDFEVTPDVLIPRPETEVLVEEAVRILAPLETPRFFEVGVGSGCISVSVLKSVPASVGIGGDISTAALAVAQRNAIRHGVSERLELRHTDMLEGVRGAFDLIVSNPPYVPENQIASLQAEVRLFEPVIALSGGADGTELIAKIVSQSAERLRSGGSLLLEIGFDQADRVSGLFSPEIWARVLLTPDLQGIPRVVAARRASGGRQRPEFACLAL